MGIGHEQVFNEIVVLNCCRLFATTTPALCAIVGKRLALDVTGVRQRHHHILWCNQIFNTQILRMRHNF